MGNIMSTSFAPECTELKHKYDTCFNEWYSEKFLKGKGLENECVNFWDDYKKCLDIHMKKQGMEEMIEQARKEAPFDKDGKPAIAESEKHDANA